MIFRQFLHFDPVAASYLFGCGGHTACAVVDPLGETEAYIRAAADNRMQIRYVIDTHLHADHISAGRALARRAGAEYVLHESVLTEHTTGVADGQQLVLGNVVIGVLHTPGHTPEHISLLVSDRTRGGEPWLMLTGHTLMVGDMGRTELAADAEGGARMLYQSARRLRALPNDVEVWPGAFSGSICGRGLSGKPSSTIGFERRFNRTFRVDDADEFVAAVLRDLPTPSANAAEIRAINLAA
jgi:glyoxylase-like metal-dependent hydrolase (beta-lactamase superfamily II)